MEITETLHQLVLTMDRALDRQGLDQLTLEEAQVLLNLVDRFNQEAICYQTIQQLSNHVTPSLETQYLIAAGCRLSSDLTEEVLMRLVDHHDCHQTRLDQLCQELRTEMRQRHTAHRLIQQAQQVRQQLTHASEQSGLGVIL